MCYLDEARPVLERREAIEELGEIGKIASFSINKLINILDRAEDNGIRSRTARTLGKVARQGDHRKVVTCLAGILKETSEDVTVRLSTVEALGLIGAEASLENEKEILSSLVNTLEDNNWHLREAAASSLAVVCDSSDECVGALKKILKRDRIAAVRAAAIDSLAKINRVDAELPGLLLSYAEKDRSAEVRASAIGALMATSHHLVSSNFQKLVEIAEKEQSLEVGLAAVAALEFYKPRSQHVVDGLGGMLQVSGSPRSDPEFKAGVIRALGAIGPEAKSEIEMVVTVLHDSQQTYGVRRAAIFALGRIDERGVFAADELARIVYNRALPIGIRLDASKELGNLGFKAKGAIKNLEAALRLENNLELRSAIEETLRRIGPREKSLYARIFNVLALGYAILLLLTVMVFFGKPLWLFSAGALLHPLSIEVDREGIKFALRIYYFLLIGFFWSAARVRAKWVDVCAARTLDYFNSLDEVQCRHAFVPFDIKINDEEISIRNFGDLRGLLPRKGEILLIQGANGTGKSSFACKVANWCASGAAHVELYPHRMLPVLFCSSKQLEGSSSLLDEVSVYLRLATGCERVPSLFVRKLISDGRLLIIFDGFSEFGETVREKIREEIKCLPIRSAMLTSRQDESFPGVLVVRVKTNMVPQGNI